MYRAGVKPWKSAGWRPSEKHIHDDDVKKRPAEVRELDVEEKNSA